MDGTPAGPGVGVVRHSRMTTADQSDRRSCSSAVTCWCQLAVISQATDSAYFIIITSFIAKENKGYQAGLTQLGGVTAPLQLFSPLLCPAGSAPMLPAFVSNVTATMTGIAAVSFFSNACRFAGCGLHFDSLTELIVHIEDSHIGKSRTAPSDPPRPKLADYGKNATSLPHSVTLRSNICSPDPIFQALIIEETDPCFLEKQEQQQPTYIALSYINRFMTDAARREHEALKKKVQPKLSLTATLSRTNVSTPPRHTSGNLTPPVTPPITPSSSFRSSTPTGSECDDEDVEFEASDSDESWTTESAISSESILSSMCMNGGDEKPFACPVPGCKKRYKNVNGIKYHAKNGHRTQIRVRKPFKCRCGKSYKTSQGLRHHTINFHPPISTDSFLEVERVPVEVSQHVVLKHLLVAVQGELLAAHGADLPVALHVFLKLALVVVGREDDLAERTAFHVHAVGGGGGGK
ncbi:hypothetical protein CCH79_00007619 [Gambusia affinis]|uniref:C2H2-type domain-containing protein n=1 Tax=Gambusia affinis TaxID=33528 RepID=A0A315WCG8_GAMAF|nr:hypothetical protein CCH79_00007619 [Gambusia affinis]